MEEYLVRIKEKEIKIRADKVESEGECLVFYREDKKVACFKDWSSWIYEGKLITPKRIF